jgi:hypothetical protein
MPVEASDDTDARHSRGAQRPASQHLQAGSCRTADDGGNSGLKFLTRSKPGNKIPDCVAPRWNETKKETVRFAFGGERPRNKTLSATIA